MNDIDGFDDANAEGSEHGDVTNQQLDLSSPGIISQVTQSMFLYKSLYIAAYYTDARRSDASHSRKTILLDAHACIHTPGNVEPAGP